MQKTCPLAEDLSAEFEQLFDLPIGLPTVQALEAMDQRRWVEAICGGLGALSEWQASRRSLRQLRVLLTLLHILALNFEGLGSAAHTIRPLVPSAPLAQLIKSADPAVWDGDHCDGRMRTALLSAAAAQDLDSIGYLIGYVTPDFELDLVAAIVLLFDMDPDACVEALAMAGSVLTGMLALHVLDQHRLDLALKAVSPVFRFIALMGIQEAPADSRAVASSADGIEKILTDAARSALWASWVDALRFPTGRMHIDRAMGRALAQLDQTAWRIFLEHLSLAHSGNRAEAMANLLSAFAERAELGQARQMWELVHNIWDAWDYGREDETHFHAWLPATLLDFPVSEYFASLDARVREGEEARLMERINTIELMWYESQSKLITDWNKLRARLRLVQCGGLLAEGIEWAAADSLAFEIDEYWALRYRLHGN